MLEVDVVEVDEVVSSLVSVSLESLLGAAWLGGAAVVVGRVGWSGGCGFSGWQAEGALGARGCRQRSARLAAEDACRSPKKCWSRAS